MDLTIAITTASRPIPTIYRSLASLRAAGMDAPVFVSVDGPDAPALSLDQGCYVRTRAERVNVAKHWADTLRKVLDWCNDEFVLIVQDDVTWAADAGEAMAIIEPYLSDFFTFYVDPTVGKHLRKDRHTLELRRGAYWSTLGRKSNGALCYGFRRAFAERLWADENFQRDVAEHARGIDTRVPAACLALGAPLQVWVPSLVNHHLGAGNSSIKVKLPKDTPYWESPARVKAWRSWCRRHA